MNLLVSFVFIFGDMADLIDVIKNDSEKRRSVIGLTAYLDELINLYNLPWTPRKVMRSMKDMATTCARTGRIWPHTVLWADRELPERALHYERLQAAQGRREARMALPNQREQFGEGGQAPEPVAGFDPEVFALEDAMPVIQDQDLVAVIGGLAPDGDIMPAQLDINGFHGLQDQTPELDNEELPELDAPVPNLEGIEGFGAWVEAVMPTPLPQPLDIEPEVREWMVPEEIP
ncbi:Uncharacterized protein APZ42_013076 [Daphnia magna]|uniref:Uncharacterized protein n=1 Tax=Daphnia magna TaxID=35525 RepID=A0A162R725_9CRUS|nr:Uncharacterized protein APZ42_013076 [Daphnia magna]